MTKTLIALVGFSKSGKDLGGDYIINNPNLFGEYKRIAFADKLKDVFCLEQNITRTELEETKEKWRPLLVAMGESKRVVNPNYWVDLVKPDVENSDKNIIITDLRRIPEVEFINSFKDKGWNVQIYHIFRPKKNGGIFENDKDTALTLLHLDFHELIDRKIINDGSEIEFFKKINLI